MATSPRQPLGPEGLQSYSHLAPSSWGEHLLPYLAAAMEACWVDAILMALAGLRLFQLDTPIMQLWSPFILIMGGYWLSISLEHHDGATAKRRSSASVLMYVLCVFVALLIIWSSVYAASFSFFDPSWLTGIVSDLLFLNANFYHVLAVIAIGMYLFWRGARLGRHVLEPGHIFNALRLGLGVIIAVIVIRMGTDVPFADAVILLLLIPIFLSLSLAAHALAKAQFLRRTHVGGLQGNVSTQERALLAIIGIVCLFFLLVTLLIGTVATPDLMSTLLTPMSWVYDRLTGLIAQGIVYLLMPIYWLLSVLHFKPNWSALVPPQQNQGNLGKGFKPAPEPEAVVMIGLVLKFVLPLLFIGVMLLLIRRVLRQRRKTVVRRDGDVHESIWSWHLFLEQLRAFLKAFWHHFFPEHKPEVQAQVSYAEISGAPTARSIREIYRALLTWSAARGYPRQRHETPFEFQARLDERLPQIEPQLSIVTDAYAAIRYGEIVPDEAEVRRVQQGWVEMQGKPEP